MNLAGRFINLTMRIWIIFQQLKFFLSFFSNGSA